MLELPPLGLYVHIPWCVRKCPYCDFNSHHSNNIPEQAYLEALLQDLDEELRNVQGRELVSVFFGGGTPSLMQPDTIAAILSAAKQRIGFANNIEITLEANPGTVDYPRFAGFRAAGINRLSMGIQSFNDRHLQTLGRIHGGQDAKTAIAAARSAGFENFNLDLMHGLPGQTVVDALNDLEQALEYAPAHLSWYQLTIEANTEFYNAPPPLPEEDTLADIQDAGEALLKAAGFEHYEVSAYARRGRQSAHNCNYWTFGDYLGIGAGAHGKITLPDQGLILRRWKTRLPQHYLERQFQAKDKGFVAGERAISTEELPLEFMMNALRLRQGVERKLFQIRTGLGEENIKAAIRDLEQRGLLATEASHYRLTDTGYRFLNDVLQAF